MFDYTHQPEIWIQIIGIAAFVSLAMSTPLYDWLVQKTKLVFKPFTCPKCMAFWIGILYFHAQFTDPLYTVLLSACTSAAAAVIDDQINAYDPR